MIKCGVTANRFQLQYKTKNIRYARRDLKRPTRARLDYVKRAQRQKYSQIATTAKISNDK